MAADRDGEKRETPRVSVSGMPGPRVLLVTRFPPRPGRSQPRSSALRPGRSCSPGCRTFSVARGLPRRSGPGRRRGKSSPSRPRSSRGGRRPRPKAGRTARARTLLPFLLLLKEPAEVRLHGPPRGQRIHGRVALHLSRVEEQLVPPHQPRLEALLHYPPEEAAENREPEALPRACQVGVVGQALGEVVAGVPAHREAIGGHPHELALRADALEEHGELELEEDHRVYQRPAAPRVQGPDQLPHESAASMEILEGSDRYWERKPSIVATHSSARCLRSWPKGQVGARARLPCSCSPVGRPRLRFLEMRRTRPYQSLYAVQDALETELEGAFGGVGRL